MVRSILFIFLAAGAAQAETKTEQTPPECQSCNARHGQLKKMKQAELPTKSKTPKTATSQAGQKTGGN